MGPKITVDSATLANKGLELIEAHFLFGLPYEQIEVVVHPTSVVHAIVRLRDGSALAHLGYPDMRVPISFALTYPERAATPVEPLDFAGGTDPRVRAAGPRDVPAARPRAPRRESREAPTRAPTTRRTRSPCQAFLAGRMPFLGLAGVVEETLRRSGRGAGRRSRRARRGRRSGPPAGRARGRSARHVNVFVAILGLGLLVLVHEAGHFFTARAVGMTPRRFYVGFPPPLVRVQRKGIEYGIGAIPLGGYVKIPGMHRPAPSDLDTYFGPALAEAPHLLAPLEHFKRRLAKGDMDGARELLPELERAVEEASVSPRGGQSWRRRACNELKDGLGKDAYWRQRTWRKVAVIFAGPGTNFLFAIILFAALFMVGSGGYRLGSRSDDRPAVVDDVDGMSGAEASASSPATGSSPSTAAR